MFTICSLLSSGFFANGAALARRLLQIGWSAFDLVTASGFGLVKMLIG